MSVHLNYDQALGHLLLHDLLIAHGGLRHLQDTVQEGEVQNIHDFQDVQNVQYVNEVHHALLCSVATGQALHLL